MLSPDDWELKGSLLHSSLLYLLAENHIVPDITPRKVPLLSNNKAMVVAGREKERRRTSFPINKHVLAKENITELSWFLVSFTAEGESKPAGRWHLLRLCPPWPA